MGVRKIRLWPDLVLTQTCARVDLSEPDLNQLIKDMFEVMYHANGRGLAAPQIGVMKQIFVVDMTWKESTRNPREFINPQIIETSDDTVVMIEQCLSIPDTPMPVARPERIHLHWSNSDDGLAAAFFDGILARCIQHEIDHLNGTVIFDHQTPQARAKLEAAYVS
jgi:peptide deformylase